MECHNSAGTGPDLKNPLALLRGRSREIGEKPEDPLDRPFICDIRSLGILGVHVVEAEGTIGLVVIARNVDDLPEDVISRIYDRYVGSMRESRKVVGKVAIVADSGGGKVELRFLQRDNAGRFHAKGNCGHLMVAVAQTVKEQGWCTDTCLIHNVNTGATVRAEATRESWNLDLAATIPQRPLPTGSPIDEIELSGGGRVKATLINAGNPYVILEEQEHSTATLEEIRRKAAEKLQVAFGVNSPKIGFASKSKNGGNVYARFYTLTGYYHPTAPLTGITAFTVAAPIPGTIVNRNLNGLYDAFSNDFILEHPGGSNNVYVKREGSRILQLVMAVTTHTMSNVDLSEVA